VNAEDRSKKDRWDKASIIVKAAIPLIVAVLGLYFSNIYNSAQNELTKSHIESEILKSLMDGNVDERKLALEFALAFARKFNDEGFERIVLQVSGTKDPSPEVRKIVKQPLMQTLTGLLKSAKVSCDAGHFYDGAMEYESATRFIPHDATMDEPLLKKAKSETEADPQKACADYQHFFSRLPFE
jgi:hypothetical protein